MTHEELIEETFEHLHLMIDNLKTNTTGLPPNKISEYQLPIIGLLFETLRDVYDSKPKFENRLKAV